MSCLMAFLFEFLEGSLHNVPVISVTNPVRHTFLKQEIHVPFIVLFLLNKYYITPVRKVK